MKKLKGWKKFFAGLLMLTLLMQALPLQALAAKLSTIDSTKQGSLTIHKYEYNVDGSNPVGSAGSGKETDPVPTNAKGLNDVKFRVTYVGALDNYYTSDGVALPTVDSLTNDTNGKYKESYYDDTNNKITDTGDFGEGKWMEVTTATVDRKDGIAKLNQLPLGIYLVHEVSAPAQITGKAPDFLVSVPMTTVEGDDWLYDVHVFPKNSSTYASVTLQKNGKIGAANAAALAGAKFILEKKGDDGTWTRVTKNNKGVEIGTNGELTTSSDTAALGKITVSDLAPGTYRFVETGAPDNSGYILDTVTGYEFEITSDGKVKVNNAEVDTSANPITVVNYEPDVDKQVKKKGENTWGDAADYSIGDTIEYRVKVDVPENVASLRTFKISDTLTNMTYVDNSFKIYNSDSFTDANKILDSTVTNGLNVATDKKSWTLTFNTTAESGGKTTITCPLTVYAGQSIWLYYEAKLTSDAVNTSAGNPNDVILTYSSKIVPETEPTNPGESTTEDKTVVYTFKIAIEKVDGNDETKKLAGAEFDLYREATDEEAADTNSGAVDLTGLTGAAANKKYMKVNTSSLVTNANGTVFYNGLSNGTYYLVETKAPIVDGKPYNLLKAPVQVVLNVDYAVTVSSSTTTDANGVATTTTTVTNTKYDNSGVSGVFTTKVKNSTGFTLPTTGGIGTFVFVFAGIALMAAAVILFITSKKKEKMGK